MLKQVYQCSLSEDCDIIMIFFSLLKVLTVIKISASVITSKFYFKPTSIILEERQYYYITLILR